MVVAVLLSAEPFGRLQVWRLMTSAPDLLEHVPMPAYAFRAQSGDFVLEVVNAEARERNPTFLTLRGKPMVGLYRQRGRGTRTCRAAHRRHPAAAVRSRHAGRRRPERRCASAWRFPQLKVLFMSGYSAEMNAVRLAGEHFLQKPFTRSKLAEKLAEFMQD